MRNESPLNWNVVCPRCGADVSGQDKIMGTACSKHIKLAGQESPQGSVATVPAPAPSKEVS